MKKGNRIAIAIIICIVLASFAALYIMEKYVPKGDLTAVISQNGTVLKTIPLSMITKEETFVIENDHGGINIILARPGEIAIIEANCPDQLCVERGFISSSIIPAVCLPNGVTVEIKGGTPKTEGVDIIVQ